MKQEKSWTLSRFNWLITNCEKNKKTYWHEYWNVLKQARKMVNYCELLRKRNQALHERIKELEKAFVKDEKYPPKKKKVRVTPILPAHYPKKYVSLGYKRHGKDDIILQTGLYWTRVPRSDRP